MASKERSSSAGTSEKPKEELYDIEREGETTKYLCKLCQVQRRSKKGILTHLHNFHKASKC